ncbi:unnamed protein product [Phytomonas sp. EM1]|nr:unnamed protein product [Phytomonas sp. EM1]|eukprot:CCW61161.1 unnamed protein product [Phytomonas sp. isolate EM1]
MSLREALASYKVSNSMERGCAQEIVARPISSNYYVRTSFWRLWDPSLVNAFGESCRRVLFTNGYHVLLCHRRIIIVDKNQQPFSFPPFGCAINDAYIERVSSRSLLVVVGLAKGVFTALIRHEDHQYYIRKTFHTPTSTSVSRIHRLKKDLFGLCYENCTVQILSVELFGDELDVSMWKGIENWRTMASSLFSRRTHRDSFFDQATGYLMVLSDRDLSLWACIEEGEFRVQCSLDLRQEAVAVLPCNAKGAVAIVVLRSGDRVPVLVREASKRPRLGLLSPSALCMEAQQVVKLPASISAISVSHACTGANTIIMYDELTMSLITIVQNVQPLPLHEKSNFRADVVSQISLNEKACSLSFEGNPGASDRGMFWVYNDRTSIMSLKRVSLSKLMREKYLDSKIEGEKLLAKLSPEYYAELLIDAALGGFSLERMSSSLNALLLPVVKDHSTLRVSPAAIGFTNFITTEMDKMNEICSSSSSYWEQVSDINRSRQRLLHSCTALSAFLLQGGWLDCATDHHLKWSCFEARANHPITQSIAIDAQAQYLGTLLDLAKHTSILAWLYMLLIEAGKSELFSGTLSQALRDNDPMDLEVRYTFDLLSCGDLRMTEKLLHEIQLLPPKAQLAVRIHSWVQRGKPEEALKVAKERMRDVLKFVLFEYVCDLLEGASSELLPTTHLLLEHYRLDPSVTNTLLNKLESLPTSGGALKRNLKCIFDADDLPQLWDVVFGWMEQHNLTDERIEIFASLAAEYRKDMNFSSTPSGRFFYCCSQEAQGNNLVAAKLFGELARAPLAVPLSARLVCIEHALQNASSDADKLTQFLLLLQKQLVELLETHLSSYTGDFVCARSVIESDVSLLQQHCLEGRVLFEIAGRYHALGGASVELDILKINSGASEEVVSRALIGMVTFLKAAGLNAEESAKRVLHEYLPYFQESFPVYPIILFLSFDGKGVEEIVNTLLANEVPPISIFGALSRLVHDYGSTSFSLSNTVQVLISIIKRMPKEERSVCILHLLQCIRGILAREDRAVGLTSSDVVALKTAEETLKNMSQ